MSYYNSNYYSSNYYASNYYRGGAVVVEEETGGHWGPQLIPTESEVRKQMRKRLPKKQITRKAVKQVTKKVEEFETKRRAVLEDIPKSIPKAFNGLSLEESRELLIELMEAQKRLKEIEDSQRAVFGLIGLKEQADKMISESERIADEIRKIAMTQYDDEDELLFILMIQ